MESHVPRLSKGNYTYRLGPSLHALQKSTPLVTTHMDELEDSSISQRAILARFLDITDTHQAAAPNTEDESELQDPSQLPPADDVQYQQMQTIHIRFQDYSRAPFNLARLNFVAVT